MFAGAVNRVPQADDVRSNMVRGGAAETTELTARERVICEQLGPALRARGLLFAGIDVIDGYLTEINVTSPTGIRAVKRLGGPDIAPLIWDCIEAKVAGRRQSAIPNPNGLMRESNAMPAKGASSNHRPSRCVRIVTHWLLGRPVKPGDDIECEALIYRRVSP